MAAAQRASREEVFAWMVETSRGARAAGNHFGISQETVRSWVRRWGDPRKGAPRQPNGAPRAGKAPARSPAKRSTSPKNKPAGASSSPGLVLPKGARITIRAEDLDDEAAPLLRQAAMRLLKYLAGQLDEPELDPAMLDKLQLDKRERFQLERALGELGWSPRGAQAASIALGVLVDKCPDILSLGRRIDGGGESGVAGAGAPGGGDAAERLRRALGSGSPRGEE